MLFYVYPLKFVMTSFIDSLVFRQSSIDIRDSQIAGLFGIYGAGFAAVFLLFAWLYAYAWKRRDALELDELERYLTRGEIMRNLLMAALALVSIGLAYLLPLHWRGMAGYTYMLVGVIETWHGNRAAQGKNRFAT